MRTNEQMKDNAQRHLDGMTANRDQMAKDVIFLADTVKRLEEVIKTAAETESRRQAARKVFGGVFGGGI